MDFHEIILRSYVIAEIGQNHQGDINIAKKMISVAKECGADCVKFQKSDLPRKFNKAALDRPYTNIHSWGKTYGEHKAKLEFSEEQYKDLQSYANNCEIDFTASAMDSSSLHFLHSLNVPFIKIGSGDAENAPLLREAAALSSGLLVSTGMCNMDSVRNIYRIVSTIKNNFSIMHCVSSYPTPENQLNLNVIRTFKEEFPDITIGYSGHEVGIAPTLIAVTLGARVVERHLTLNKSWKGSDHVCSLTPPEFSQLVREIRIIETDPEPKIPYSAALGSFEKSIQESEKVCIEKLGKTLVATHDLEVGQILNAADIAVKVAEPKGIACRHYDSIIGKELLEPVGNDESIFWSHLKQV